MILRFVLVIILACSLLPVRAQNLAFVTGGNVLADFSSRWSAFASGQVGYVCCSSDYLFGSLGVGGEAHVFESFYVRVGADFLMADYQGLCNRDYVYGLSEAISFKRQSGLRYGIMLQQRILSFHPSRVESYASRAVSFFDYRCPLGNALTLVVGSAAAFNMQSELESAPFLQRISCSVGAERTIGGLGKLSLSYVGMFGSKEQFYIAEMHNLHCLRLIFSLDISN